jgi:hypothetical protein
MKNTDFQQEFWIGRDIFSCISCSNSNDEEFELWDDGTNSWEEITNGDIEDIYNENDNEAILRCKNCKTKFKIITSVEPKFDYFVRNKND